MPKSKASRRFLLFILLLGIGLTGVIGYYWLMSLHLAMRFACKNTLVFQDHSPDGHHSAALFERACGATTGFSTQISVLRDDEKPLDAGNAFRADDDHGAAQPASWGGVWAEMKWMSPDHLLIRYDDKARVFSQIEHISSVAISYEKVRRQ